MKKYMLLSVLGMSALCFGSEPLEVTIETTFPCISDNNGTITVTVTGGTPNYEVTVNGDAREGQPPNTPIPFEDLRADDYVVSVTDSSSEPVTIIREVQLPESDLKATAIATPFNCVPIPNGNDNGNDQKGGTIFVVVTGTNAPYTVIVPSTGLEQTSGSTGFFIEDLVPSGYFVVVKDSNGCSTQLQVTVEVTLGLTVDNVVPENCFPGENGSITITATQGTAPFKFSIDGGDQSAPQDDPTFTFENVATGQHQVLVEDSSIPDPQNPEVGCARIISVVVPEFNLSATSTPSSCAFSGAEDGTIIAVVTGGKALFTFSLDGVEEEPQNSPMFTFRELGPDEYTVSVVDGQGCTATTNETVFPSTLDCSATTTPQSFAEGVGGSITVTVLGGEAPFRVTVNGRTETGSEREFTFGNLATDDYTITVVDDFGCKVTKCVEVLSDNAITNFVLLKYCTEC